jgi:hypothetical protein
MRKRAAAFGLSLAVTGALITSVGIASAAGTNQSTLVSAAPSTHTPNINDGTVFAIAEVGSRIIVGGDFTSVSPPGVTGGGQAVTRNYILAFNPTTGAVDTGFVPTLDGTVETLKPGPTPDTVYVGGHFNHVNGATGKGITLLSTVTGQKVAGFTSPSMNGVVYGVGKSNNHLLLAGTFTTLGGQTHNGVGSINATTGATEQTYITTSLTGHHNYNGSGANGAVGPRQIDVSPDGTRAVVIGNFKQANGVLHDQIALLDLGTGAGTLNTNWNTSGYTAPCANGAFDTYLRDVAFSPDGSYFAVVATGGGTFSSNTDGTRSLCDTTTRWTSNATGTNVQPLWINYSGNDSYLSVATTGTAIYVGGHQRWSNNADASDSAGPGAVPRPGVMALDPVNGVPFAWNPGRNPRGSGAWSLLATVSGLYMGSDTDKIGTGATYTTRGRIAFFPLAGGESVPQYTPATLPANVYLAGQLPLGGNSNVLYRVNAGGSSIPAIDNGPDWEGDTSDPSPYRNSGSNSAGWSQVPSVDSTVPATTPSGIFNSERWDPGSTNDGGEMQWSFPVAPGTPIEVRLYFANRYTGTDSVGSRVFDVALDGSTVLDHYDIVADAGTQTGHMRKWDINAPAGGNVTVGFTHEVENPLINGIEIVRTDIGPPPPGQLDTLRSRSFTGTTAGATTTLSPGSIAWGSVRGAFMAGNTLFYGYSDGNLYRASFDGTTVGTPSLVDPYNDPIWSNVDTGSGQTFRGVVSNMYGAEMQSVTGMVLDNGRLYFATAGSGSLHWRGFEPDDGVLTDEQTAPGGVNFANISGMFLAGSTLYYADKATGDLHAVAWNGGAPGGIDTVVSGPGTDGNDWRARGLFALPAPAPTAAFTSSCNQLDCAFDGSGSVAPGGTITSYGWDFGDGNTGTGVTPTHTFGAAGSYTVTLTITSSLGGQASVSHIVQPFVTLPSSISFVGATHVTGNAGTMTVNVPATVQTGDGLLLLVSGANAPTITGPSGWTLVGTSPASLTSITTQVYRRVATGTDAGASVSVGFSGTPHSTLEIVAYRGTDTTNFVGSATVSTGTGGTTITSPTATTATGTTWVVSFFSAKSSTVTGWTIGGAQTTRDVDNGTGSGRTNSVVVDSGTNVPAGTVGGILGTTDVAYGGATAWTIVIQ